MILLLRGSIAPQLLTIIFCFHGRSFGRLRSPPPPPPVAFFSWIAAWEKALTIDNLRKRAFILQNWCCMCQRNGESVDDLFLHCPVATDMWSMVFGLFVV